MSIVIVYGPQGAGKTSRGEEMRRQYGCSRIVDDWNPGQRLRRGDLALTNASPPFDVPGATVIHIEQAKCGSAVEPEVCPACGSSDVVDGECQACEEVRLDAEADEAPRSEP